MFELSAGQIVADKYRIDGIMGTGGMGVVVAATRVDLEQRVAIKFLREVSPEALARFQREARLLVRLKSAHVARVFDVGALEDDTPYIVMEHLDGSDLASVLTARGRLPFQEAVDYTLQASEAVAEAHALGMVHRDIKPANLFLAKGAGGTTTVKVLDFGVSKILDDRVEEDARGGDLTNEGVALGSPGYMSPEQMTSARDVDERSDIFSLGALLYRLVAGQPPYKGSSIVSILAAMATEKLAPLHTIVPDVPPGLAAVVDRCLAQDRAERWPTVAHFAQALLPYATRRGRLAIEQISTTLGVPIPEDGLTATIVRPATTSTPAVTPASPVSVPVPAVTAVMGPVPSSPPFAPTVHSYGAIPTAGGGPISAPISAPLSLSGGVPVAPPPSPRAPLVAIGLVALVVAATLTTWALTRSRAPRGSGDDEGAGATSAALSSSANAANATGAANTTGTGASTPPPPIVTTPAPADSSPAGASSTPLGVEPPTTPEPPSKPKTTPTPVVRPKTPPTTRTTTTTSDPSKPPNPADVPGGRH